MKIAFWTFVHNCIAHPLLMLPFRWVDTFHDWTADKMAIPQPPSEPFPHPIHLAHTTHNGFAYIVFTDASSNGCSLRKSSLEAAIFLGIDRYPELTNIHLTQDLVRELLPYLQLFADTGEIDY